MRVVLTCIEVLGPFLISNHYCRSIMATKRWKIAIRSPFKWYTIFMDFYRRDLRGQTAAAVAGSAYLLSWLSCGTGGADGKGRKREK